MADSTENAKVKTKQTKQTKQAKPSFWKGIKSEYKKITWPDRETTVKQSIAVVAISLVIGVIIAVLDLLIQYGVNFITSI